MEDLKQITKRHQIDKKGNIYKDGKLRGKAIKRTDGGRTVHRMTQSSLPDPKEAPLKTNKK